MKKNFPKIPKGIFNLVPVPVPVPVLVLWSRSRQANEFGPVRSLVESVNFLVINTFKYPWVPIFGVVLFVVILNLNLGTKVMNGLHLYCWTNVFVDEKRFLISPGIDRNQKIPEPEPEPAHRNRNQNLIPEPGTVTGTGTRPQ